MHCQVCQGDSFCQTLKTDGFFLEHCACCGLVRMHNPAENFDVSLYDYYKDRIGLSRSQRYSPITGKRYERILHILEKYRRQNTLFEIGPGEGHFLYVAQENGWGASGVDVAPFAVRICKDNGLNVSEGEFLSTRMDSESLDAVIMFEVIEHLTQPHLYLERVYSLLRKGGVLMITTPNFNALARHLLRSRWSFISREHLFYFTTDTLRRLLRRHSFKPLFMRTKNITIPEYFIFVRKPQKGIYQENQHIRVAFENSAVLSSIKHVGNCFLNLTGLGETIECLCQKI